jgi:sugar (pentulose or hexulose) kinase
VVSLTETLQHDLRLVDAPISASVLCPYFVPTAIDRSDRHRPHELQIDEAPTASQLAAQALVSKAVEAGKVSAADVSRITFEAIREGRFYIYSHPQALGSVAADHADAEVAAELRSPASSHGSTEGRPVPGGIQGAAGGSAW